MPPSRSRNFFWLVIVAVLLLSMQQTLSTANDEQPLLIINELVAANQAGITDEDGDYSDWVEIHNPGRQAVNLTGWFLTDDPSRPEKWSFPDLTLDGQAYLLVFTSGKDRRPAEAGQELHTNFKLDRHGEFLGLYHLFSDRFIDLASLAEPGSQPESGQGFPRQFDDVPYGRYRLSADDRAAAATLTFGYLATATPGQPNDHSLLWAGLVAPVEFSRRRGFYETPFTVDLSTATPDTRIRYTTDGSRPTESHGTIYSNPLTIETTTILRAAAFKPGFHPSPVATYSYIFMDDVLAQSDRPAGFPENWGGYKGAPVKADYEMDPEIVNHPRYTGRIKEALTSIPTMAIVTDRQSLHELYANPARKGRAWERPVSVEYFDPTGSRPEFQIDAGLRLQGELGRAGYMPKHAFRLFFRRDYDAPKLQYPLFADSPLTEFDTLVLRSGVNRSYAGYPEREEEVRLTTYTRDEWLRASQLAMSGSGAYGTFVHLYLNGLYWGLYNLVERPDDSFMAAYFGGAEEEWDSINHGDPLEQAGSRFKTLHKLAGEGRLDDPDQYATIQSYLDIPHFIDYLILNWYAGNRDWGFNNWYAGGHRTSGPVKYFVWDGERIWRDGAEIFIEREAYKGRPNLVKTLFEALLENPDFRMELADRMYGHLFNDGALTETNAQQRWLNINRPLRQAIIGESARWGDTRFERPLSQEDWFIARDDVLAQMEGNVGRLIALAREAGYYPELDPPAFNQPAGHIPPGFRLTMTAIQGTIYYTTDGSDPRMPVTGAVNPEAGVYSAPLELTATTPIKARVLAGSRWSALHQATYQIKLDSSQRNALPVSGELN